MKSELDYWAEAYRAEEALRLEIDRLLHSGEQVSQDLVDRLAQARALLDQRRRTLEKAQALARSSAGHGMASFDD
jgi:adenylate kinase family enzyme